MRKLAFLWVLSALGLLFACSEGPEPKPEPVAQPRLDAAKILLHQRSPGQADAVSGSSGAVTDAEWAVVLSSEDLEIARTRVELDGSFAELSIGDNTRATVRVVAEDAANVRSRAVELSNDILAPELVFEQAPGSLVNMPQATFVFSCSEAGCTFRCRLDEDLTDVCRSPVESAVDEGSHRFSVEARDAAGNMTQKVVEWDVDLSAPVASIDAGPEGIVSESDAVFRFSCDEADCEYECAIDGAGFTECEAALDVAGLADGPHTLEVRASDPAGNVGDAAARSWAVDSGPPLLAFQEGPAALTGAAVTFHFGCTENCSFECALDGSGFVACASPWTLESLSEGTHAITIRGSDPAGNAGAELTHTWEVDLTPPTASITLAPGPYVNSTEATFAFACDEASCTFACSLNGGAFAPCTSPHQLQGLREGDHTLAVRATDVVGNEGSAVANAWVVDTSAPEAVITGAPPQLSTATMATLEFGCNESSCDFACSLDDRPPTPCTPPQVFPGLAEGAHTFAVHAVDPAGNEGPAANTTWSIDSIAPAAQITGGPAALMSVTDASISFACNEADCAFECSLDGGAFAACASPQDFASLPDGPHAVAVRATDGHGNTGPAVVHGWSVDTEAPVVSISDGPTQYTVLRTAVFQLACSEPGCSFACAIDGGAYAACSPPVQYHGLALGEHTFSVRATDPIGHASGATTVTWSVIDTGWVSLAAGEGHSCGISVKGQLYCWGNNSSGQLGDGTMAPRASPTLVGGATDWTSIATGGLETCGIRGGGQLYCWGQRLAPGWNAPTPTRVGTDADWMFVSIGAVHACAIRSNGQLYCWGLNQHYQLGDGTNALRVIPTRVGTESDWTSVVASDEHSCGIRGTGMLYCWGTNYWGRLGIGPGGSHVPARVGTATNWVTVSARYGHTCGILSPGELYCWGLNASGQLGDGTTTERNAPARVGSDSDWVDVALGRGHSCGVRASGGVWCWGNNRSGELGNGVSNGNYERRPVTSSVSSGAVALVAGVSYTCSLHSSGATYCWGRNDHGKLGIGAFGGAKNTPTAVASASSWSSVSSGGSHSCGITDSGALYCWGSNLRGGLGDGGISNQPAPVRVGIENDWQVVASGWMHTCGIRGGALYCWGYNSNGQLGDGSTSDRSTPVRVGTESDWVDVSASWNHTCGLRSTGAAYCWGSNSSGQLGDGTTLRRTTPVQVGGSGWTEIRAGYTHSCGVNALGELYCWGSNLSGALGNGGTANQSVPTRIGTSSDWIGLSANVGFNCALNASGALYCWGTNDNGQLGDGTTTDRSTPIQVGTASNWAEVSTGSYHTCATTTSGTLHCWGKNYYGQLGNGQNTDETSPVQVGTAMDWAAVASGGEHTCAMRTGGALECWGEETEGQLGDDTSMRLWPTLVPNPL